MNDAATPAPANDSEADFTFTLSAREVTFNIDEQLCARDAIYGACYIFIDRCYVFLARSKTNATEQPKVSVRLRSKETSSEEAMEALAGEFANELLNSQLRHRIGQATAPIREQYMARAFFTGQRNATVAELLAELDAEELEEEPLDIAVPWDSPKADADGSEAAPAEPETKAAPTDQALTTASAEAPTAPEDSP